MAPTLSLIGTGRSKLRAHYAGDDTVQKWRISAISIITMLRIAVNAN
jgi:hypothetical protein